MNDSTIRHRDAPRRLDRFVGVLVIIALMGLALWARFGQASDATDAAQRAGIMHLQAAVAGDSGRLEAAREKFVEAVRGSVIDAYPMFCLSVTDYLKGDLAIGGFDPALAPALVDLKAGDLRAASQSNTGLVASRTKDWMGRLLGELREK